MLVSPVKESHKIMKHLADYVLVWSTRHIGSNSDDIGTHYEFLGTFLYILFRLQTKFLTNTIS
jgi:hypothetical protein